MEIKDCIYYFSIITEGENSELIEIKEDTPQMDLPQIGRLEGKSIAVYYVKNPRCIVSGVLALSKPGFKGLTDNEELQYRVDRDTKDIIAEGSEIPQGIKDEIAQKIYQNLYEDLSILIEGKVHV